MNGKATVLRPDWDEYALGLARAVATRADCRRSKVGAVILDADHRVVSTGYNGAPAGQKGCLAGACPRGLGQVNTSYDNCIAVHAEANAILYAHRSLKDCTLYVTKPPCADCSRLIAGAQIGRVVVLAD